MTKQATALYAEAAREPQQHRGQQGPQVSKRQLHQKKQFQYINWMVAARLAEVILAGHKKADRRPDPEDDEPSEAALSPHCFILRDGAISRRIAALSIVTRLP
jgi:hypothetical protein